jgi:hypothetical protein
LRNTARDTIFPTLAGHRMASNDKTLARMRVNPRDWRIEDLKAVARRHGVAWRQPGTSHVTFRAPGGGKVTVPARKPIKPVYIRQFVALIDTLGTESDA